MRISNIKPQDKTAHLEQEIERVFRDVMNVQISRIGSQLSLQFRLLELKPNRSQYDLSENWYVVERRGIFYPNSTQKRLIAKNIALGCENPINRAKFLQEEDWILVNKTLNRICDKLGISATIRSSLIKIRDGKQNVWLSNYLELLKDIVEVKGEDYTYSKALRKTIDESKIEDKYKFESVFLTEPFEVDENTRITQKIFTDYDELDALAKTHGYIDKGNTSEYCGWIATMGDEFHNPISMLREAMQKLRDTQKKHGDAIMGFCQTGNFSIGYTVYTKTQKSEIELTTKRVQRAYELEKAGEKEEFHYRNSQPEVEK